MISKTQPLQEMSIRDLYCGGKATYEVPIYQRNYAWGKDEIFTLIQDVYDSFTAIPKKETYFIGTLTSFHKGDQVYEVIDGQQRLTTINLVLGALAVKPANRLTYRARNKSNYTIEAIRKLADFNADEADDGIMRGFRFTKDAIAEIVQGDLEGFKSYFLYNVHLIHYQVPKDIDLNHYFEIMNSRGEQLEKHEIVKAQLIEKLAADGDKAKFSRLWEYCGEMNVYIQQKYRDHKIFGENLSCFNIYCFDKLPPAEGNTGTISIRELIGSCGAGDKREHDDKLDSFQPIIDFSNFLLLVLKLTRLEGEEGFEPTGFNLDDKELLHEFEKVPEFNEKFVKRFGYNLLLAKYLLDNYLVHHSNEDDSVESDPWKLQCWQKNNRKEYPVNLAEDVVTQQKLERLLSMFEVSFTARQRKNYLFYCLLYLFRDTDWNIAGYYNFVSGLADKYFRDVYLASEKLNAINTPMPGSFDGTILKDNEFDIEIYNNKTDFVDIYGDGTEKSKGIPLFVFNYLDYKLWEKYSDELRGEGTKEGSPVRRKFFESLGCSDFGLKLFEQFYFSRTRRSLEHYYPQANVSGNNGDPNEAQINCFGNYAMIGSEANSSGSNWSPKTKRDHYLDSSGKIKQVSVASIKFMIMMQICQDNQGRRESGHEWDFGDIKAHQEKMLAILGL